MKKRIVSLLLAGAMVVSLSACGKEKEDTNLEVASGTPTYEDNQQMEMAAYCGPRRSGYRYWNGVYGEYEGDPEGGWDSFITKEAMQDYMDCGFTYVMAETDAPYDAGVSTQTPKNFEESALKPYMDLCESMNIPVVVYANRITNITSNTDYRLTDEQKSFLKQMVEDLSDYKMFKGVTFRDEPSVGMAKTFGAVKEYLDSLKPDMYYFTSFLPIYASDLSLYSTEHSNDRETAYKDYVDAFSDATGSFAYDSYPLISDPVQGTTSIDSTWFQNLRIVAENAKAKGQTAGITIQSCAYGKYGQEDTAWHRRSIDTKEDVTFQLYTSLAYGMKYINYFTYWQHWALGDNEMFYSAMVMYPEKKGSEPIKTPTYYAVKDANAEIKKFDHVILNFDWEGTMALTGKGKTMSQGLKLAGEYKAPRIASATATDEAIIGCMKDGDGFDGYMIANATDPAQKINNTVTVEFRKATKALVYIEGEETEITLKDGSYTFELAPGEGVFVIPIQ